MTMKNLDNTIDMNQIRSQVNDAIQGEDKEAMAEALVRMAQGIHDNILKEAQKEARSMISSEINDRNVLNKRGINTLTSEERKYYAEVIEKRGFTDLAVTLPTTVFDRVFEDLEQNHPLLSEITFENTTAVTEWIIRKTNCEAAWWGPLTDPIKKELQHGFDKVKTDMYKLSAFMPVSKAMLDLGPEWLDRYVRTVLSEAMAIALEAAIIAGTGKDQPIGMIKNLKGAVVDKVYPDKDAIALADLSPETLGKSVMAPLTKGGTRAVPSVLILVNPLDYWTKIFAATTFLTQQGTYVYGVMPIPSKIVQSVAVPQGKMVAGMGKDYFMGVGSGQKIEFSDEYKFLEDERTYLAKQYATGEPKDNDSFLVFDISSLSVEAPKASKSK
ncbi:phage major capsid protein [Clostridium sardiniense]|uniref:phage major capsid protein n=1 Tax=Clostridium sardiniense TaxID=29369 RepID=UPI003D34C6AC